MACPEQAEFGPSSTQPDRSGEEGSPPQIEMSLEACQDQSSGRRVSISRRMKDSLQFSIHQLRSNTGEHDLLLSDQTPDADQGDQQQSKQMSRKRTRSLDLGMLGSKVRGAVGLQRDHIEEHQEWPRETAEETGREINEAEQGPQGEGQKPQALQYSSSGIHSAGFLGVRNTEAYTLLSTNTSNILRTKSEGEADSRSHVNMASLPKIPVTRPLRINSRQETSDLQSISNRVNPDGQENEIQVVLQVPNQKERKQIEEPAPTLVQEKISEDHISSNKTKMIGKNALCKSKSPLWVTAVCTLLFLAAATAAITLAIKLATKSMLCPEQWIWIEGKCYHFSQDTKDWKSSQAFCSSYGGSLALLKDPRILDSSTRFKDSPDYWIGLRKTGEAGRQKWQWVDGSDFQDEVVFTKSEGPELDCAYLNSDKTGNLNCASMRPWICVVEGN